jgi:hypothetical protein
VSVETSHPRWLIEKWISDFGFNTAEQIAVANNTIPKAAFRLTARGKGATVDYEKSSFVEGAYITPSIDGRLRELADAGEVYFQDEASQMVVADHLQAEGDPRGDLIVLDYWMLEIDTGHGIRREELELGRPLDARAFIILGDVIRAGSPFESLRFDLDGIQLPLYDGGPLRCYQLPLEYSIPRGYLRNRFGLAARDYHRWHAIWQRLRVMQRR